jgi:hypothetical protein
MSVDPSSFADAPELAAPLPASLHVTPWHDPVVDRRGHDPRSAYVEEFWLGVLGPPSTTLMPLNVVQKYTAGAGDERPGDSTWVTGRRDKEVQRRWYCAPGPGRADCSGGTGGRNEEVSTNGRRPVGGGGVAPVPAGVHTSAATTDDDHDHDHDHDGSHDHHHAGAATGLHAQRVVYAAPGHVHGR